MEKRFTYGDQFSAGSGRGKVDLEVLLGLCAEIANQGNFFGEAGARGDRDSLQSAIADTFFSHTQDPWSNAGNTVLSLNAYGIIDLQGEQYTLTDLTAHLLELTQEEAEIAFAQHILVDLEGLLLLKVIEDMKARGEDVTLESLAYELIDMGIEIPPNSTYISTMRSWLHQAGVFPKKRGYTIDWDRVNELVDLSKGLVDDLYDLNREHKYFLLAMVQLGATEMTPSNKVAEYVRSVFRLKLTTKSLVADVIEPLEEKGLIDSAKTTGGRGAKPHDVKLSEKADRELLQPFLQNIAEVAELALPTLNKSFEEVVNELDDEDPHTKGVALELLAVWIVRLLGLKFTEWRVRDRARTGGGEVDVLAASDRFIYNRWQIQCKNTAKTVGIDVVAKEYGMSVMTQADVIVVVTTSSFSEDAKGYAEELMRRSRFYVILLDGRAIDKIKDDRTAIVEILNEKARKVFFRKEVLSRQLS